MGRFVYKIALLGILLFFAGCVSSAPSQGVYHTVQKGQTLYKISKVYGVEEIYLARINKINDPTQLRVGERIYIPGATSVKYVPPTVTSSPPKTTSKPAQKPKQKQKATKSPTTKSTKSTTAKTSKSAKAPVGKGSFIWPVKGKLVKKFNTNSSVGNKGIEISVKTGTSVSSAAAGKVIYSGDGISGYGNLLIVRHDDTFFTVYGYNKKNLVQTGAFVSKGERIALSGKPPSGGQSRIYFEIRYGKKPVNPLSYLP
jgi:lipoprotein NlpD